MTAGETTFGASAAGRDGPGTTRERVGRHRGGSGPPEQGGTGTPETGRGGTSRDGDEESVLDGPDHDDDWNSEHRAEAPLQRADRNFAELLQELRVAQTGVQILFAFLLTLSFTQRFAEIDAFQRGVYVATLVASAVTAALLVAPVAVHRMVFQRGRKRELVTMGHRLALAGLACLAVTMTGSMLLVLDVAVGRLPAALAAAAIGALFATLWLGLPLRVRGR